MAEHASIVSYVAIAISVITTIIAAINHKRIRSSCFGHKMEVSVDIEDTTPTIVKMANVKPPAKTDEDRVQDA